MGSGSHNGRTNSLADRWAAERCLRNSRSLNGRGSCRGQNKPTTHKPERRSVKARFRSADSCAWELRGTTPKPGSTRAEGQSQAGEGVLQCPPSRPTLKKTRGK